MDEEQRNSISPKLEKMNQAFSAYDSSKVSIHNMAMLNDSFIDNDGVDKVETPPECAFADFEKPSPSSHTMSTSTSLSSASSTTDDRSVGSHGSSTHSMSSKGSDSFPDIETTTSASTEKTCSGGVGRFRLEDVYRVRDEATALRNTICELRTRLEEVEEDRDFQAAKANELTELLGSLCASTTKEMENADDKTKMDLMHKELVKKSIQIAGMTAHVEKVKAEKQVLMKQNVLLEKQRDTARSEMEDLSLVVRSLQNFSYSADEDEEEDIKANEEEVVLTSETALNMTLGNMKTQIETLEDALQKKSATVKKQKKHIAFLEKENEMCATKVGMLEELFRELNQDRIEQEEQKDQPIYTGKSQSTSTQRPSTTSSASRATTPSSQENAWYNSKFNITKRISNLSTTMSSRTSTCSSPGTPAYSATALTPVGTKKENEKMKRIKICFRKAGLEGSYTGPLDEDGKPHGVGTIRFSNGDTFLGEMTHGKMSGKGTLYTKDRGIFRGQFLNNKYVGPTVQKTPSTHGRRFRTVERQGDGAEIDLSQPKSTTLMIEQNGL